ncbi:MAG: DUF3828 domain-containing protein [Cytophagaceae bacterium]|nr:DUF3828 domain-containing protein [Gemmatimonadaceae bacterium]
MTVLLAFLVPTGVPRAHAPTIDYPEGVVRDFLKMHFAGSRAFTARGLDKKERLFTRRFRTGLYKFFEKQRGNDSLPLVVDPFTGSQGATDFTVGDARVRSEKAWVPVQFTDGSRQWTVTYLLRNDQERNDDRWKIDDIEDRTGLLLSKALQR